MQSLYHLPNIQEKILNFDQEKQYKHLKDIEEAKDLDEIEKIKMKKSKELVLNLQKLFAGMLLSNVKYQDPTKVLESIVDDNGTGISINEQKDIGEFFMNFFDRLQDGLGENKSVIRKLMGSALTDSFRNSGPTGNAMPKLPDFSDEQKNILVDMQK